MLYQISNGSVSIGGRAILNHIDFEIKGKEKIAVTGSNGAGKTTLLKLIAGELGLDRDDRRKGLGIVKSRLVTIGMLRQIQQEEELDKTVEEILLENCPAGDTYEKERFQYESEYDRLFTGFGFGLTDKGKQLKNFSGGEQTKIAMIRLLLSKPDILLLDEPTNHLDIETTEWLEQYMREYDKAVVMVSHDRFFLDEVAETVYELSGGKLKRYVGNYSEFVREKRKQTDRQMKAYEHQQEEIKKQEQLIEKFKHKPTKASFARSRKKMLERMPRIEKPDIDDSRIHQSDIIPEISSSKNVFESEHLVVGYDKALYELTFRLRRGMKVAIMGPNGVGKTTLIKTIMGMIEPIKGSMHIGNNVVIGYFDQNSAAVDSDKSVLDYYHDEFPALTAKEVRNNLGAYLFRGNDVAKKVKDLSGGEKSRLVLAVMLNRRPNFLILDEPTNHCDIRTKEVLEAAFRAYKGTMIFISHDRYFIKRVASSILMIEPGQVYYYPFGYGHYLERKRNSYDGESAAARMKAEEQALVSGLKAVPEAEKHRLRELSTQEAYLDWRFGPVKEKLLAAEEKYAKAYNELVVRQQQVKMSEKYWADELKDSDIETELSDLIENASNAYEYWHNCCLEWNDTWLEIFEDEEK